MKSKLFPILLMLFFVNSYSQSSSNFRDSFDIQKYTIKISQIDFKNKTISANTTIKLNSVYNKSQSVTFDFYNFTIDSIISNNKLLKYIQKPNLIKIFFQSIINQNEEKNIIIYYNGAPETDPSWGGFYIDENYAFNMGVSMNLSPHSFGRAWFPCFDNFADKAEYSFEITVPVEYHAICSGILDSISSNIKTKTFYWSQNQQIPTYLASVAIDKYISIEQNFQGVETNIKSTCYVKLEQKSNFQKKFINLEKCLKAYEEKFGDFRWNRIGFVTVPFNSGAMEHACNIAIPDYAVDGTTENEYLYVHEFAHNWFGNLVTCKNYTDMWLNEGGASFAESVFIEYVYGKTVAKNYIRKNHKTVLEQVHLMDNGYFPLVNFDENQTYNSTVYKKGADVFHALKGFLGDSIFYDSMKKYFSEYAFKSISVDEFQKYISKESNTDLSDFFQNYIYQSGFSHFSINKINIKPHKNYYNVSVEIIQKLKEKKNFTVNNRIELSFFDKQCKFITKTLIFGSEISSQKVILPFSPVYIGIDLDEKLQDASIHKFENIKNNGLYNFESTDFQAMISNFKSEGIINSILNEIPPDKKVKPKYKILENKYWTIEGIKNYNFDGIFYVNTYEFGTNTSFENLQLLYRETKSDEWKPILFSKKIKKTTEAFFIAENISFGEYAISYK